ncbi:MAG: sulfotransferase family protein [Rhodobacter sp.]|nr:sulfotransferase family protein [Rhodobacter sp.]
MIISAGRRYIFVHIPKTGGTALSLSLEERAMKDDILIGDTPKAKSRRKRLKAVQTAGRLWKHSTLADIDGLVDAGQLDDYLLFTLVRNPWDRMVSYYHWLQTQDFDHHAVRLAQRLPFAGFLAEDHIQRSIKASPYGHYLRDATGTERQALFVRLEHLLTDLAPLEAHLGFRLGPIPRVNASPRNADYRLYYSDKTAEMVAEICAADIRRFQYAF